jgi:hypothetical protein
MPTNHVSIQDSTTHLPDGLDNDVTKTFDAPGLNTDTRPFLSYRVQPDGGSVTLQMDLNGNRIVDTTFGNDILRSLNEVIDNGFAVEADNELVIRRQAGPGSVDVSDIIFVYSADA